MEYHIYHKVDKDYLRINLAGTVGWVEDKAQATSFDVHEAHCLAAIFNRLMATPQLIVVRSETWVLRKADGNYNPGNSKPSFYFAGADASEGITWHTEPDKGYLFESQEEAEDHSQALKTLFNLETTPKKLTWTTTS